MLLIIFLGLITKLALISGDSDIGLTKLDFMELRSGGGASGGSGGDGGCSNGDVISSKNNTMAFYIQNPQTGLVLDVKYGRGPEVIMYPYVEGPNQQWEYRNGMIYSKLNGLVLEVDESYNMRMSNPHGDLNQLWEFEGDGMIRSKIVLVLDVRGGNKQPGTPVIAYPNRGGLNQIFRVVPVAGRAA